jgi:hypothetical protein
MSIVYPYLISTLDTLVHIDTRNILYTSSNILVYISTNSLTNGKITIRDIGGNSVYFEKYSIIISTIDNILFDDGSSSQIIQAPYGFLTINGNTRLRNWSLLDLYCDFSRGSADTITITSSLNVSSMFISSILCSGNISTQNMNVQSIPIQNNNILGTFSTLSTLIQESSYVRNSAMQTAFSNMQNTGYITLTSLNSNLENLANSQYISQPLISSLTLQSTITNLINSNIYISRNVPGSNNGLQYYTSGSSISSISSSTTCIYSVNPLYTILPSSINIISLVSETSRLIKNPNGIAIGKDGTIYITDSVKHIIIMINQPNNICSIIGGNSGSSGYLDGLTSLFNNPTGIAVYNNIIYIADTGNNRIRTLQYSNAGWIASTLSGNLLAGNNDGSGIYALFNSPQGLAIDDSGTFLYVADTLNNSIRRISLVSSPANAVTTMNWIPSNVFAPKAISIDSSGRIWILGQSRSDTITAIINVNIRSNRILLININDIKSVITAFAVYSDAPIFYHPITHKLYTFNQTKHLLSVDTSLVSIIIPNISFAITPINISFVSDCVSIGGSSTYVYGGSGYPSTQNGNGSFAYLSSLTYMAYSSSGTVYACDIGSGAIRIIKLNNFVSNVGININGNVVVSNIYASSINGVYTTGTLLGTAGLSDRRIKTNIRPISNALEKVVSLRGVRYREILEDIRYNIGFIAQEVEKVVPELIYTDETPEQGKSIFYGDITALLIESVKQLKDRLDALEPRVRKLCSPS